MAKINYKIVTPLNKEQKEAIGLLSIGTFLEYFDLMLYVHMAVLLNTLFFPQTDPFTSSLLAAFAFCSTYILRPFGALLFGYIGDRVGRKATVILTTTAMSVSCIVMANLPTYDQIGIAASWIITICRMTQGLSTMGEVIGANIYITEITKPPVQYPAVTLIAIIGTLGGVAALGISSLVTTHGFNWRLAFWIGACVAIVGSAARTKLRETPEFADAKLRIKNAMVNANHDSSSLKNNPIWNEKVKRKTALALFAIECSWPVCFYFTYIYCSNILTNEFNVAPEDIIRQNFMTSIIQLFSWVVLAYLSYFIYPIKLLRAKFVIFSIFILAIPYLLYNATSPFHIFAIQIFVVTFGFMGTPAVPIFYRHLPVFKRFTYSTLAYALSRAVIYIITSFGLVYCYKLLGHWGIWVIMIPIAIAYFYAINYFQAIDYKDHCHLES